MINMSRNEIKRFKQAVTRLLSVIFLVSIVACSSKQPNKVTDTASIPLQDLNLARSKIPPVLADAHQAPYAIPSIQTCQSLDERIDALDEVLEPDVDVIKTKKKKSGVRKVTKAAVGTINQTVKSIVPFRGWLRKLSGAERHSKQVNAVVAAGVLRRAFLKGIKSTLDCPEVAVETISE
jgi:hypothetical protein